MLQTVLLFDQNGSVKPSVVGHAQYCSPLVYFFRIHECKVFNGLRWASAEALALLLSICRSIGAPNTWLLVVVFNSTWN